MSKIAFFVPYQEMEASVRRAWELSERQELENGLYPGHKFEYSVHVYTHRGSLSHVDTDADVLVARGATALGLKHLYLHQNKHVVEIPVTATDLVSTIRRAIKRYGNLPIAITGTYNMTYGSGGVLRTERYKARLYHSQEVDDLSYEAMVRTAMADGCKIIIGGTHTTDYARSLGLYSERLSSSVESLLQAISNAKAAAVIAEKERESAALSMEIINNIPSGTLAFDSQGNILAINRAAREMLGISPSAPALRLDKLGLSARQRRALTENSDFDSLPLYIGESALSISRKTLPGSCNVLLATISRRVGEAPAEEGDGDLAGMEKRQILHALSKCGMNRSRAAEMLGMSRTTLWRKINKYGIK